ncbi:MAG: hypothetical protein PVJ92_00080 [Candidatus Dependentiae bacterium]|jgi:hypothetical protein
MRHLLITLFLFFVWCPSSYAADDDAIASLVAHHVLTAAPKTAIANSLNKWFVIVWDALRADLEEYNVVEKNYRENGKKPLSLISHWWHQKPRVMAALESYEDTGQLQMALRALCHKDVYEKTCLAPWLMRCAQDFIAAETHDFAWRDDTHFERAAEVLRVGCPRACKKVGKDNVETVLGVVRRASLAVVERRRSEELRAALAACEPPLERADIEAAGRVLCDKKNEGVFRESLLLGVDGLWSPEWGKKPWKLPEALVPTMHFVGDVLVNKSWLLKCRDVDTFVRIHREALAPLILLCNKIPYTCFADRAGRENSRLVIAAFVAQWRIHSLLAATPDQMKEIQEFVYEHKTKFQPWVLPAITRCWVPAWGEPAWRTKLHLRDPSFKIKGPLSFGAVGDLFQNHSYLLTKPGRTAYGSDSAFKEVVDRLRMWGKEFTHEELLTRGGGADRNAPRRRYLLGRLFAEKAARKQIQRKEWAATVRCVGKPECAKLLIAEFRNGLLGGGVCPPKKEKDEKKKRKVKKAASHQTSPPPAAAAPASTMSSVGKRRRTVPARYSVPAASGAPAAAAPPPVHERRPFPQPFIPGQDLGDLLKEGTEKDPLGLGFDFDDDLVLP